MKKHKVYSYPIFKKGQNKIGTSLNATDMYQNLTDL